MFGFLAELAASLQGDGDFLGIVPLNLKYLHNRNQSGEAIVILTSLCFSMPSVVDYLRAALTNAINDLKQFKHTKELFA